ncbi:hypothetical protein D3C72_1312450 [compost metagenome]
MITNGSAASGWLSMAVTKMARGVVPGTGVLLKGRVRNAVHKPLAISSLSTCSRGNMASSAIG